MTKSETQSKCPACRDNIPASRTTLGDADDLCSAHATELNQYMAGVITRHESETQLTPRKRCANCKNVTINDEFDYCAACSNKLGTDKIPPAPPSWETQLTLQELRDAIARASGWFDYNDASRKAQIQIDKITDLFQQALTSLKSEMEKKKVAWPKNQDYAKPFNDGISECQKLVELALGKSGVRMEEKLNNNAHSVEEK